MIRYFGNNDPTTRGILEHLLKEEEDHASDLADLLYITNPETGETEGEDPAIEALPGAREGSGKSDGDKGGRRVNQSPQPQGQTAGRVQSGEMKEAEGRTTPPQPDAEEEFKKHNKERDRILNELRWMGKNKKKPAA
jgi:hypothetical protein